MTIIETIGKENNEVMVTGSAGMWSAGGVEGYRDGGVAHGGDGA